ncbi:MAG: M20/M25/M40 family metallo-hydrolase, partial [Myxococcota bacterium]|nr:M20/M25/M40 family metallo-hydrolase [Myxococcota bacterium]
MHGLQDVAALACDLIATDTRPERSNGAAVERCIHALRGFEIETLDYMDDHGIPKQVLAARSGKGPCLALCGHLDTVGADGWTADPWTPTISEGRLYGLGSSDMKGPVAALLIAAASVAGDVPVMVLLTADEETSRAGVNALIDRSALLRESDVRAIVVGEPTGMVPTRGHRASVNFTATATGLQAHSATGLGTNANWALLDFLQGVCEVRRLLAT